MDAFLTKLVLSLLLLGVFWQTQAAPASLKSREDIEMQDLGVKRLTIDNSCSGDTETQLNTAINQAMEVAKDGVSTIDWIVDGFEESSDKEKKRRIGMPMDTMMGNAILRGVSGPRSRSAKEVQGILSRVSAERNNPVVIRCNMDFLKTEDPEGNKSPPCADEQPGRKYRWNAANYQWVSFTGKLCTSTSAAFVMRGNGDRPDQLVMCPYGLKSLANDKFLKDIKEDQSKVEGEFIDMLTSSPPLWMLQTLLMTRGVGQKRLIEHVDLGNGKLANGWEGVRTLVSKAINYPGKAVRNVDNIAYLAVAWYLDKWNWGPGKATDPSVAKPRVLSADHFEKNYGKGKTPEEVDLADVRRED